MQYPYTAQYVDSDDGWVVAFAAEYPTIITQGRTIQEARENLREAVTMFLEANRQITYENLQYRRTLLIEPQLTNG